MIETMKEFADGALTLVFMLVLPSVMANRAF